MLIDLIKIAISLTKVEPGNSGNAEWRDAVKKAWAEASAQDHPVEDLLWEISKLRGQGNALMMNAHQLLIVAKRMCQ